MKNAARLSDNDKRILFRNTADKMGLSDAIVEKDFWVCFTLDYLFHRSPWKDSVTFKGGTSLSKAYNLINRFSEDIDLILDWRVLGYEKDEPWEKRSNTKQDAFNKEANARAEVFLKETFCPVIRDELSQELEQETNIYIDEVDRQTVIFSYPRLFTGMGTLQVIRLEIGALAAWTPAKSAEIVPYAAEYYPDVFKQRGTDVLTVAPERTFWEKATILHHESNRPEHLEMPQRYSRHYYDLYRMAATSVKEVAFSRLDLLKKVVDFKMKFYPRAWAKYSEAVSGSLKLEMIDLFVTPLCTVLATAFLTMGIIGPIFSLAETYVLDFTRWLITVGFGVGSMLMGSLYPLTVVCGIHHMYNVIEAGMLSAALGIAEPAIFGVNLRLVKPLVFGTTAVLLTNSDDYSNFTVKRQEKL